MRSSSSLNKILKEKKSRETIWRKGILNEIIERKSSNRNIFLWFVHQIFFWEGLRREEENNHGKRNHEKILNKGKKDCFLSQYNFWDFNGLK